MFIILRSSFFQKKYLILKIDDMFDLQSSAKANLFSLILYYNYIENSYSKNYCIIKTRIILSKI